MYNIPRKDYLTMKMNIKILIYISIVIVSFLFGLFVAKRSCSKCINRREIIYKGGVPYIEIRKSDGKILKVIHRKQNRNNYENI